MNDWTQCNHAQIMEMVGYLVKGDLDISIRNQGGITTQSHETS